MSWTTERVDLLKKLWMDGLSASQIAGELGEVTRNAVIGKVHRLGLSGRTKTTSPTPKQRRATPKAQEPNVVESASSATPETPRPAAAPQTHGATALKMEDEPIAAPVLQEKPKPQIVPISQRATILTLNERTCKWPIGDPSKDDFYFCGQTSEPNVPYCPYHCRMAYQPMTDRRSKKTANA